MVAGLNGELFDVTEQSNTAQDPMVRTGTRLEVHSCDESAVGPYRLFVNRTLVETWVSIATGRAVDRVYVHDRKWFKQHLRTT